MSTDVTHNIDLVVEVIDALLHPSFDGDHHFQHVAAIRECLERQPIDAAKMGLLEAIEVLGNRYEQDPMRFALETDTAAIAVADRLKAHLPHWPVYLYHGTVASRLSSIQKSGLQPAFRGSRWGKRVGADYLEQGVFFTTSWRSATNWSPAIKFGPDGGTTRRRTVAVIRLVAERLKYEKDGRARTLDCVVVPGGVPIDDASYAEGWPRGMPNWLPLKKALSEE